MKLTNNGTSAEVNLPRDMLWTDEFNWSRTQRVTQYSLAGSLILEVGERLTGRPISLEPPDREMAWITRAQVQTLLNWANSPTTVMTLALEYPTDSRTFTVVFAPGEPIEASPIKEFPGHENEDWFRCSIKLLEVVI